MSSEIAVRADNISKVYLIYGSPQKRLIEILFKGKRQFHKKFKAVQAMSFEIKAGETVGIVGRNGSGKSTLLQMIAGTLTPTSGTMKVNGKIGALLELGSGFHPDFTGRENVYLYGGIMQMSRQEINDKIDDIVSFADIGDFTDQPIKTYSSGMHVRLAFSAAIHIDPDVLLIDEALAVGDPAFQLKCFERISDLKKKGKTIIFVSHDINIIAEFCDRVFVLSHGELVFDGKSREALNIYKALLFTSGRAGLTKTKESLKRLLDESESVRLSKAEHRFGNGEAEIFSVILSNRDGQQQQVFLSNEEVCLHFRVRAHQFIREPIYGIRIKNEQGLQIYMKNSLHQRLSCPPLFAGDTQEIRFRQRLHLASNDYFLSVGVSEFRNGELVVLDRRNDVLQFKVVGAGCLGIANLDSVIELV